MAAAWAHGRKHLAGLRTLQGDPLRPAWL